MKFKDTNTHRTAEDIAVVVKLLSKHAPYANIKGEAPVMGVARVFRELVLSDECLERGEVLTRIAQIHQAKAPLLMEYVNEGGPWAGRGPALLVTVRNNGTGPIPVVFDEVRHYDVDDEGVDKMDSWTTEYMEQVIGPGETIELRPHYAFIVLYDHCKRLWNPKFWNSFSNRGQSDTFEEVGFRCRLPMLDAETPAKDVKAPKGRRKAS